MVIFAPQCHFNRNMHEKKEENIIENQLQQSCLNGTTTIKKINYY